MYQRTIVELSSKQWKRYQSNSIFAEDAVIDTSNKRNPLVSYKKSHMALTLFLKGKRSLHCVSFNIIRSQALET